MSDVDAMVAWLRSVWDADEQAARAATDGPWEIDEDGGIQGRRPGMSPDPEMDPMVDVDDRESGDRTHMARHDPRDTLTRIQAERRIVDQYEQARKAASDERLKYRGSSGDTSSVLLTMMHEHDSIISTLEQAVRALASGYRHRAGWQQGWAP
ncbi:DUF6221 family protein [Streptomonospora arabica]|uniref:DUF6221 family protein n=1 Tax=Streptomonospora arabica TaxID=412417 RepID=A0ABV9SST1_9ACTN